MGNVLSRCAQNIRDFWQNCRSLKGNCDYDEEKCTYHFSRESLEKYKIHHSETNESITNVVPDVHFENEGCFTKTDACCQLSPLETGDELQTATNICHTECSIQIPVIRNVLVKSRGADGPLYENQDVLLRRDHYMLNSVSWPGSSSPDCTTNKSHNKTRSEIITNVHMIRGSDQHIYENQSGLRLSLHNTNTSSVDHNFNSTLGATKSDSAIKCDFVSNLYNCYKININKNDLRGHYKCDSNICAVSVAGGECCTAGRHSVACCSNLMQTKHSPKLQLSSTDAICTKVSNLENTDEKHVADVKVISRCCSEEQNGKLPDQSEDESLVIRQKDLLKKLGELQKSVCDLSVKYGVSFSKTAALPDQQSVSISSQPSPVQPGVVHDIVIHADPSSPPWSVFVLCQHLMKQFKVLPTTFTHSSVTTSIPDKLRHVFKNGLSIKRREIQVGFTVIWKKVKNGPVLLINTGKQSPIFGETNIARYLGRLLNPSHDSGDIVMATVTDEWLDMAELQIIRGNKKEKASALRSLNTRLGRNDWIVGSAMSLVDIVMWSVLYQSGQVADAPAKVKKWLKACNDAPIFSDALCLMS